MTDSTATTCYRHPDRPTRLSCTTCGKPICVECSHDASVGQKCPSCAKTDPRARVVRARTALAGPSFATTPVSFGIMVVTGAIFVMGFLSPELQTWLYQVLALVHPPAAVIGGELVEPDVYRIFTVALVHGGLMHILFNMYALYLFGPRLEQQVGSVPFAALYLASAGAGGFASMAFGSEFGWAVGASGAIFGLFGAWMFVAWKMRHSPGGRAMFNQLGFLMAINIALPFLVGGIDWLGHLGGFVAGVAIAFLWSLLAVGRHRAREIRTVIAAAATVAAAVGSFLVM
ncbi:MAG: rhomboid family intramembrane serine protease [Acidimicrobiia bacterium]